MNKEKRIAILTRLRDENPHPTTELNFTSPFELLIAVLLSAQATDVSVNKATALLYPVANTPKAMLELGVEGVKSYIKTIGLFNSKAENVIKTCRILLEQHGGEVPEDRAALEALPGVGRKPRTWCSIRRLAGRRSPWIRISSAFLTAPTSPPVKMLSR
jgi:endonuclease-3